jgi:hypothetical protein
LRQKKHENPKDTCTSSRQNKMEQSLIQIAQKEIQKLSFTRNAAAEKSDTICGTT